jgi:MoaA/NifB/PqqE/SkfB family radical SAM enzyme
MSNELHIETTTRCTLFCPACPRTTWSEILKKPVPKNDLDVELLARFLDCPGGKAITKFKLCGDYGDSIYYPKLFHLIEKFRSQVSFQIVTNGSRQTQKFWNKLSSLLTKNDTIIFSIDGLEHTNHLYRINSDWPSIMQGLDIMVKSPANIIWKTIIFDFNYNRLKEIKDFAESKGATFHAEKTHRYGNPQLQPPETFIESNHLFDNKFVTDQFEIEPRCEKEAKVITADGYLSPCDWIRNPRTLYKSQLWKQKERWLDKVKIENNTYDQAIMVVRDWENYVRQNSLTDAEPVDVLCKMLCRKGCVHNNIVNV